MACILLVDPPCLKFQPHPPGWVTKPNFFFFFLSFLCVLGYFITSLRKMFFQSKNFFGHVIQKTKFRNVSPPTVFIASSPNLTFTMYLLLQFSLDRLQTSRLASVWVGLCGLYFISRPAMFEISAPPSGLGHKTKKKIFFFFLVFYAF